MGNDVLYKVEKEIKYKHSKKEKPEIDNNSYINHLSILNNYFNYTPDFLNISFISTEKQIKSAKEELGVSRDEVVDVLKVVLLTSGMQPFNKALQIANKIFD